MNSPASSLPEFIVENPRLGDWFALALPGKLTLKTGKVEIGQDILTALRQIAAEELELPFSVVDVLSGDTSVSPDEGPTVASLSIMMSGPAVRVAAAEMRGRLFQAAAARLGVPASQLSAVDGVFHIAGTVTEADVPGVGKIPMPPSAMRPFNVEVAEFFKIQNGKIRQVEGVQLALPYKAPTGWDK